MIAIIIISAWALCGIIASLGYCAYLKNRRPRRPAFAGTAMGVMFVITLGPIGLSAGMYNGRFKHGINPFRKP